ncbi:MAG: FTR1 family iron permease [Bifidobacteriaceae bacterium]|nr:FTR1 family iron permease [Bifidobacteriaceae bacterium]
MIRKTLLALLAGAAAIVAAIGPLAAGAAHAATDTWGDVVEEMTEVLEDGYTQYLDGAVKEAKAQVDVAYYTYYEALGFEKVVMAHISGKSASQAEYEFGLIKKEMDNGDDAAVRAHTDALEAILQEQAAELDGAGESAAGTFIESLVVILREGFEAILVLGAIIAYLIKSGNRDSLRVVYGGAILALVASAALAVAIKFATAALGGANQEIIEGVTVLIAAVMLIWVSNWILGKSEAGAWARYIKAKTEASLSRGSVYSLAAVAFLAVFREGAETILLYQALASRAESTQNMLWVGLGVGAVALVAVYLAIRYLSIRIPIRPFFLGTSVILAVLAFSFAGSGIKELQEGGVVPITQVTWAPTIDLLGIYPAAQTLGAQALVLVIMVGLSVWALRRARRSRPLPDAVPTVPAPNQPIQLDQLSISASISARQSRPGGSDGPNPNQMMEKQ